MALDNRSVSRRILYLVLAFAGFVAVSVIAAAWIP